MSTSDDDVQVVGGLLRVPAENFQALAPPGWRWRGLTNRADSGREYLCQGPKNEQVLLVVGPPGAVGETVDAMVRRVLTEVQRDVGAQGYELKQQRWVPSGAPGPGSHRLTARLVSRSSTWELTAYLFPSRRLYVLSAFGRPGEEPPGLKAVLRSFHLLTSPPAPPEPRRPILAIYALGFLLLALATGWEVNSLAGRPVLNGGQIGVWGIGMALIVRVGMLLERSAALEEVLYAAGELGLPLCIAILAAAHFTWTPRQAGVRPGSGEEARP